MEWIWILIPLAGIAVGIVAILTEHRQKMAMIEKGLSPQDFKTAPSKPEDPIRSGALTMAVGVAFLLATVIGRLNPWLLIPAFICICVGGTILATALFRTRHPSS
jgi:hypothetical protein